MNNSFASLFAQAPGLADSFNDIFNNATPASASIPPTPAALPPLDQLAAIRTNGGTIPL